MFTDDLSRISGVFRNQNILVWDPNGQFADHATTFARLLASPDAPQRVVVLSALFPGQLLDRKLRDVTKHWHVATRHT